MTENGTFTREKVEKSIETLGDIASKSVEDQWIQPVPADYLPAIFNILQHLLSENKHLKDTVIIMLEEKNDAIPDDCESIIPEDFIPNLENDLEILSNLAERQEKIAEKIVASQMTEKMVEENTDITTRLELTLNRKEEEITRGEKLRNRLSEVIDDFNLLTKKGNKLRDVVNGYRFIGSGTPKKSLQITQS